MHTSSMRFSLFDWGVPGLEGYRTAHYQLGPGELEAHAISLGQATEADSGALVISTGDFTGRSPKDRYIVRDSHTEHKVDWNEINLPFSPEGFDRLFHRITRYFRGKDVWIRDGYVCADPGYRLNIRVFNETPWANLFCYNMFLRPAEDPESIQPRPDWLVIQAPGCLAVPGIHGTRQENFVLIHFTRRILIIGGTAYTGEIKKGIFSILNYLLPLRKGVLSMHCSANVGSRGDTAIFFGLSGTGKTTLSTDPRRKLIGDDEHGWNDAGIFNFEGGCYAKCIDLCREKEPQIYRAVRKGALLENTQFHPGTRLVNYADKTITENTRVSYPLYLLNNVQDPSLGPPPRNIFFLSCDAYGVLPPIARLTPGQAMFQFLSGYTAKVAGTEVGVTEPRSTFSACYGAPFLPLHPLVYARMLGEKLKKYNSHCWLINTGWTGGSYGQGKRISLSYTRALIHAALDGALEQAEFSEQGLFRLQSPLSASGVPSDILHPRQTWADPLAYDIREKDLALAFRKNFDRFATVADPEIRESLPGL